IDNKVNSKGEKINGAEELLRLEINGFLFPPTLEQTTPTGGKHLIYRVKEPVRQGVNVLGKGLDIRAFGGYIVGAGSTIRGLEYTINDHEIADAPEWLVSRCRKAAVRESRVQTESFT